MKHFNLPPDLCADILVHALDGKASVQAAEVLEAQDLSEPASHLRQGCDLVGYCTVENCAAVIRLSQIGNYVMLADFGNSLGSCAAPDILKQ